MSQTTRSTFALITALLLAPLAACGPPNGGEDVPTIEPEDTNETGTDTTDTGVDTYERSDTTADAGDTADAGETGPDRSIPTDCTSASPAPTAQRTEVSIERWSIASPPDAAAQDIVQNLRDGTFEFPDGFDYDTVWRLEDPNDDGSVPTPGVSGSSVGFAVAKVTVPERTVVAAEVDDMYRVFTNGTTHPGGVYGHGNKMTPIELHGGTNLVVVQFVGRQSPKFQLFETADSLAYNLEDTTTPELRVGHSTEQPLGVHVMNLTGRPLKDVDARVLENQYFEATTAEYPFMAPNATTQLTFDLKPKSKWSSAGNTIPVEIAVSSCGTAKAFQTTVELKTVGKTKAFRRTFRSPVDLSTQYYGVLPPKNFSSSKTYGVALALHGAGVQAKGHVTAYTKKEWLYHVAPTNRRRYGFNWEEWGKFNGMNALDHAMGTFDTDPSRVYVTGHSMGGHGTWHLGIMHPGRFATVGPSAGWESIYNYGGSSQKPSGAFRRARAHSETARYLENLADRGAYIIHGGADNNVPTKHGRTMRDKLKKYTSDVKYHEEPGAGHWWDRNGTPGTDCVDWDPLFTFFNNHTLDPSELDFKFKSPGPWYTDEHSYVKIRSSANPMNDVVLESTKASSTKVELTTTNVRSMELDGQALADKGIQTVVVDGMPQTVQSKTMEIGPQSGKKPGANGTFNQVLRDPFCFVYPKGDADYRAFAAYLVSNWAFRGNGHTCALPANQLDGDIRSKRNLVYLGVDFETIPDHENRPFRWDDEGVTIGSRTFQKGVEQVVFPTQNGLGAAYVAVEGDEELLYSFSPFSSRNGMPDYVVLADTDQGLAAFAAGFFDNEWKYDPQFGFIR